MQMGINTNIQHQGKTLHVQTEDSGSEHPHIITHLFLAGQIIASERLEYSAEGVSNEMLQQQIKEQHRKMLMAIQAGQFDKKILLAKPKKIDFSNIPLARNNKKKASHSEVKKSNPEPLSSTSISSPTDQREIRRGGPWSMPQLPQKQSSSQPKKETGEK